MTTAVWNINNIPHAEFLSVSKTYGVYACKCYWKYANLWTRIRHSANHLWLRIDTFDGNNIVISIEDICSTPTKLVQF